MKFDEIIIKTDTLGAEFLSGELIINGVTTFSINDPKDFLDIIKEKSVPFDYYDESLVPEDAETVTLTVYLPQNEQGKARKELVLAAVSKLTDEGSFGSFSMSFSESDDRDWENNWKEYFHPINIGEKLIVKPSWENCDAQGRTVLEIDPESSFGSGRHETTKLCLELMEKHNLKNARILDMGCGSGILGIAACLLGAEKCIGVDIEQNAADIANKNAIVNRIPGTAFTAYCGNILEDIKLLEIISEYKYDLIVSNIVADVLTEMTPIFKGLLNVGGCVILSGVIEARKERVLKALADNGFEIKEVRQENDWLGIEALIK